MKAKAAMVIWSSAGNTRRKQSAFLIQNHNSYTRRSTPYPSKSNLPRRTYLARKTARTSAAQANIGQRVVGRTGLQDGSKCVLVIVDAVVEEGDTHINSGIGLCFLPEHLEVGR